MKDLKGALEVHNNNCEIADSHISSLKVHSMTMLQYKDGLFIICLININEENTLGIYFSQYNKKYRLVRKIRVGTFPLSQAALNQGTVG